MDCTFIAANIITKIFKYYRSISILCSLNNYNTDGNIKKINLKNFFLIKIEQKKYFLKLELKIILKILNKNILKAKKIFFN